MAVIRWGAAQRVNTTSAGDQDNARVAVLRDGGFVVVWRDGGVAGDSAIRFQRYDTAGNRVGPEGLVTAEADDQTEPAVAALPGGGFVIVLTDEFNGSTTNSQIEAYRYDANGAFVRTTTINTGPGLQNGADVSGNNFVSSDGFQVVYHDGDLNGGDIRFRQISADGTVSNEQTVNTVTAGAQTGASITRLRDEQLTYAVTWVSDGVIYGRLVDTFDDVFLTPVFQISSVGTLITSPPPEVVGLVGGQFVVVWQAFVQTGVEDPGTRAVRAAIFNYDGGLVRADFAASTLTTGTQDNATVAPTADGGFVVIFKDGSFAGDIRVQKFNVIGEREGGEVVISDYGDFQGGVPGGAAMLADGRVVVVWTDDPVGGATDISLQIIDPRNGYVQGGTSADTLYGGDLADQILGQAGDDLIYGMAGGDLVFAGFGADRVFAFVGDDVAYGGPGADTMNGGTGDDTLYGEADADVLIGELGDDLAFGQEGNDTINGSTGFDALYGGAGDDVMLGEGQDDALFGGDGGDVLYGGRDQDVLNGETGGDTLLGELGDDLLDGGAGGDLLDGGAGVDNLIGGLDGDVLIGGADGDRLEGGAGGDVYWWRAPAEGNDLVVGFTSDDQLQFTGAAFGFAPGASLVAGTNFIVGGGPTQATPTFYLLSGGLYFDPDGTGGQGPVFMALINAPLTAADFQFV